MERVVELVYEDNAKPGDWCWEARVVVRTRTRDLEEFSGFGMSPVEALTRLGERVSRVGLALIRPGGPLHDWMGR
jgi:hypothetical protein